MMSSFSLTTTTVVEDDLLQQQSVLHNLPQYLLEEHVLVYLYKGEKYQLLSTCKAWRLLLHQTRSICISSSASSSSESRSEIPRDQRRHRHCWHAFLTSEDHRVKILKIADCSGGEDNKQKRKLKLRINLDSALQAWQFLADHAMYFYHLEFVGPPSFNYNHHHLPIILHNPTSESITRLLCSDFDEIEVGSLDIAFQYLLKKQQRDPQTLRGINRLVLSDNSMALLESSLEEDRSMNVLQYMVFEDVHDLLDVSALQGIPEVYLHDCNAVVVGMQALAQARLIHISSCSHIRDVSTLSQIKQVTLMYMTLGDISMLGQVQLLRLKECKIGKYPVPSKGWNQDWSFEETNIADLTGYQLLHRLQLIRCDHVKDISMLGTVRYLTIEGCNRISFVKYPKAIGHLQEWRFIRRTMQIVDLNYFTGLHRLVLEECEWNSSVELAFANIHTLELIDCAFIAQLHLIENINTLIVEHCLSFVGISQVYNVQHINVWRCPKFTGDGLALTSKTRLRGLELVECCAVTNLNFLHNCITTLRFLTLEQCLNLYDIHVVEDIASHPEAMVTIENCPKIAPLGSRPHV